MAPDRRLGHGKDQCRYCSGYNPDNGMCEWYKRRTDADQTCPSNPNKEREETTCERCPHSNGIRKVGYGEIWCEKYQRAMPRNGHC